MYYDESWLRSEAEKQLGEPITDEQWDFLDSHDYVHDLEMAITESPSAFANFANTVRKIKALFAGSRWTSRKRLVRISDVSQRIVRREEAVAGLLAADAGQSDPVRAYRDEVLNGVLLRWEDVETWLAEQARKAEEGSSMLLITSASLSPDELHRLVGGVPQEGGGVLVRRSDYPPKAEEQRIRLHELGGQLTIRPVVGADRPRRFVNEIVRHYRGSPVRILRCYVPDLNREAVREVSHETGVTGMLERLRRLSQDLATTYGWDAADATRFVLTGLPPHLALITEQIQVDEQIPAHSRIILAIDPTITPVDVADYYQQVRKQVLGRHYRKLSDKHLELARFAASRPQGESGIDSMTAWNKQCAKEHPTWRYNHASNFIRDRQRARQHLLHPNIHRLDDEEAPSRPSKRRGRKKQ